MASTSEVTIGAKVSNAEKVLTYLQSFTDYTAPDPALTVDALQALVASTKEKNTTAAAALQGYSSAVETRVKLVKKDPDSVIKSLSPIGAAVRSSYGKQAKEATDMSAMITKIRGIKVKKEQKDPKAEFVSQSQRSYGSITQNFSDLITTLTQFGSKYNPANPTIAIATLTTKLESVTAANIAVTSTYGKLTETRDDRSDLYKNLNVIVQRIKDAIKSQYGLNSTEYKLIKSLKV